MTGRQTDESRLGAVAQNGEERVVLECREEDFGVWGRINKLYKARGGAKLSVNVREDGLKLRGARGHGAGIVEHVDVPDVGNKGGDWRAVIIVARLVIR